MPSTANRTFSLSEEQAAFIDAKVAAGDFGSSSEVVSEGLRVLQERDASIEGWLREEVAPAFDEARANPESLIPAETVFADLRARLAERLLSGR